MKYIYTKTHYKKDQKKKKWKKKKWIYTIIGDESSFLLKKKKIKMTYYSRGMWRVSLHPMCMESSYASKFLKRKKAKEESHIRGFRWVKGVYAAVEKLDEKAKRQSRDMPRQISFSHLSISLFLPFGFGRLPRPITCLNFLIAPRKRLVLLYNSWNIWMSFVMTCRAWRLLFIFFVNFFLCHFFKNFLMSK